MSSTNTRLASSFKKLAAGLQVSQGDEEVAGAIALLQKHIKNVEYDAEDDPQVDIAVHALQTRAASSMEFLTKYEKIADKSIAGFGEIIKVAAHVVEDRALQQLVSNSATGTPLYTAEPTETPDVEDVGQLPRSELNVAIAPAKSIDHATSVPSNRRQDAYGVQRHYQDRDPLGTVMSPAAWGKIQNVKVRNNTTVATSESPSSLIAELARVNLGRAPSSKLGNTRLQNTMMNNSEGDGFNGNMRNAKTPGSPYFDELENSPLAISFNSSVYIRAGSGAYLNVSHDKSISVELGARPSGPWELGNAAFRDDDGVVKFGDVLTLRIGAGHRSILHSLNAHGPLATTTCLVADHAIRSVTVRQRALGGADRWAVYDPNRPPRLRGSKNIAGTLSSCSPVVIRANAGQFLAWEDGNHSPILSDEPHIWYIVHYNAPYVRHCLSALIPTTYSNISSDIEKVAEERC